MWAELWALRLGIQMALDMSLNWVIFEMDSKVVVDMVHNRATQISLLKPPLQEVVHLLNLPSWKTSLVHSYRDANKWADLLANKGHSTSYDGVVLDSSFPLLDLYLLADVRGVCTSSPLGWFLSWFCYLSKEKKYNKCLFEKLNLQESQITAESWSKKTNKQITTESSDLFVDMFRKLLIWPCNCNDSKINLTVQKTSCFYTIIFVNKCSIGTK